MGSLMPFKHLSYPVEVKRKKGTPSIDPARLQDFCFCFLNLPLAPLSLLIELKCYRSIHHMTLVTLQLINHMTTEALECGLW